MKRISKKQQQFDLYAERVRLAVQKMRPKSLVLMWDKDAMIYCFEKKMSIKRAAEIQLQHLFD